MYLASSRSPTRIRWVFVYLVWIFAEILSLAPLAYSIFAIVMWTLGDMLGPAFFLGIVPGFTLFQTMICIARRNRLPWHTGDYVSFLTMELQVRQVRLFHTVLWCNTRSGAMPHRTVKLYRTEARDTINGSTVYHDPESDYFTFFGWERFMAYVWPIFCEMVVFAIFLLSMWFMFYAGAKAAVSFAIGSLVPLSILSMYSRTKVKKGGGFDDRVILAGSTWLIMDICDAFHLRLFILYELIVERNFGYI